MGTPRIDRLDRNAFINGCLEYWQRGNSFTSLAPSTYFADRFRYNAVGPQVINVTRSSDAPVVPGFSPSYSIQVAVGTANASPAISEYSSIVHIVENTFMRDLVGETVTLLFSIKSPKTGVHYVSLVNGGGTSVIPLSFDVTAANTWQRIAVSTQLPLAYSYGSGAGSGLIVHFPLLAGANFQAGSSNSWITSGPISGPSSPNLLDNTANIVKSAAIELCKGSYDNTKSFSIAGRDLIDELQLCRRYYESASVTRAYTMTVVGSTAYSPSIPFIVAKRGAPLCATFGQWYNTAGTPTSFTTTTTADIYGVRFSGPFAGAVYADAIWTADAEF